MSLTKLQYYMKTGICKFGSTCKFHHPRDRLGRVSANILGFPLRQVPICLLRYYILLRSFFLDLKQQGTNISSLALCKRTQHDNEGLFSGGNIPDISQNHLPKLSIRQEKLFVYETRKKCLNKVSETRLSLTII